jgi:hypothetical protein
MTKRQTMRTLDALESQGFDCCRLASYGGGQYSVRVRCSQCEALVINGMATHESGCPNKQRRQEENDKQ